MGGKRGRFVSSRLPGHQRAGDIQQLPLALLKEKLGPQEAEFLANLVRYTKPLS